MAPTLRLLQHVAVATTLLIMPTADCQPAQASNPLRSLPALTKQHYSWPTPINASDPVLLDYARITHSLSIAGAWATEAGVQEAVAACHASDLLPPPAGPGAPTAPTSSLAGAAGVASTPRCSIVINFSPWSEDESPWPKSAPPTQTGSLEDAELQYFSEKLGNISSWVANASEILDVKPAVQISAVMLDQERFNLQTSPGNAWNLAIERKNNLYLSVARRLLPTATTFYYNYGGFSRGAGVNGWGTSNWFTLNEDTDIFSTSLYTVPEIGYQREAFNRTVNLAVLHNASTVVPWLSLGCGYRRQFKSFNACAESVPPFSAVH